MRHTRFVGRLINRPQLITPSAGAAVVEMLMPEAQLLGYDAPPAQNQRTDRDYYVTGTTAVIPVVGKLVHRGAWMDAFSGICSYQGLGDMICDALRDPGVEAIALELDSPGGEAAGCLDFAEWLAAQRGNKPIWAVIDQEACSAAYAIASAADRILIGKSGYTGSIGVVGYHVDISEGLKQGGVKVTYLSAGAHKIDFAPEIPLTEQARTAGQAAIDAEYARLCEVVAANRNLSVAAVRRTEAAIFRGQDAVSAGLADAIATPEEAREAMTIATRSAPAGSRMTPVIIAPNMVATIPPAAASADPSKPASTSTEPPGGPTPEAKPAANAPVPGLEELAPPQAIADACTKAGHPQLIAGLLSQGASMKAVETRLTEARGIAEAAKSVGHSATGERLIASGVGLETARSILFDMKAAADGAIRTDPALAVAPPKPKLDAKAIYAAMNKPGRR